MDKYLEEIIRLKKESEAFQEDNPTGLINKIDLLSKCLVYVGKVSSIVDGDYKRIYARRKYEQALAEASAMPPKKANAELQIYELRMEEAEAYQSMQRWRNAFESTREEINALKLKLRIIFQDGSNV